MSQQATADSWDEEYDFVVLGAGAGGLTAALVASIEGMRTLLVERSDQIGGTTARSSGTVWIPNNPEQRRLDITDDAARVRTYLDALVGARAEPALREAFIDFGPQMLEYLEKRVGMRFQAYRQHPDYRQELPGAADGGRPLEPPPFDGRTLGAAFARVRAPLPELMLFGGMMVTRGEAAQLLRAANSLDAFLLGVRLTVRYLADRMRYSRGTRLVLGNALAARLFKELLARKAAVWYEARTTALVAGGDGVSGLVVARAGRAVRVRARRGVVLAGGGFPASAALRARYLPQPVAEHTAAFEGCVGETLQLGLDAGAALGAPGEDNALWFPSSVGKRADGTTIVYPHIVLDRSKPGLVAVNKAGRRFVDEAVSYHQFVRAMYRAHRESPCIPAMLVCDRRFIWKYGLGMIRPRTPSLRPYVDSGYLHTAQSIEALAGKIGVDPTVLADTVRRSNAYAKSGVDAEFGKGDNAYDRNNGDPENRPNPCLGVIGTAPYCAVAVYPTPLGTSLGLRTNAHAEVCDAAGRAIAGLYACGNDMHSVMGGEYPGAGAQLGPAMTFGYVAALHAAARAGAA